jgi:hypothetical protein
MKTATKTASEKVIKFKAMEQAFARGMVDAIRGNDLYKTHYMYDDVSSALKECYENGYQNGRMHLNNSSY